MAIGFIIGIGIALVGAGFVATGEHIDGITLILVGACWIDEDRISSELVDLKSEVAKLRRTSNDVTNKREHLVIG